MIFSKRYLFVLLTLLMLQACRGVEVDIPLDFEGEKIVLWGRLEAGKPAKIQVSKTFNPIGLIPEENFINTAHVYLYKNGSLQDTLTLLDNKGFYGSEKVIEGGAKYVIKAKVDGLPTAESDVVVIPMYIPEFRYTRERNIEPEINFGIQQELVTFYLKGTTNQHLMIAIHAHYNDFSVAAQRPSKKNIVANEEDCHAWTEYLADTQYFMFKGNCVTEDTALSFFVDVQSNIVLPSGQPINTRASRISVDLVSVTKEWFEYNKIENKQPEGLDHLVLPPQKAYTNITNGYGLIYGSNSLKSDLM